MKELSKLPKYPERGQHNSQTSNDQIDLVSYTGLSVREDMNIV